MNAQLELLAQYEPQLDSKTYAQMLDEVELGWYDSIEDLQAVLTCSTYDYLSSADDSTFDLADELPVSSLL